jgi:hypothetical protein
MAETTKQTEQSEQTDDSHNSALENVERARLFALYGGLGQTARKLTEAHMDEEGSFDEAIEADEDYRTMVETLEILDKNRDIQDELGLTQKNKWSSPKGFVKEMFEKGNKAVEISIRADKDGHFVLSHWSNEDGFKKGRRVGRMTTDRIEEHGKKDVLDDVLEVLRQYKAEGNNMIIQIKTLGKDSAGGVAELLSKLKQYEVEDSVAIGSMYPRDLAKVHQIAPNIPLIANKHPVFGVVEKIPGLKNIAKKSSLGEVEKVPFGGEDVARIHELIKGDEWTKLGAIDTAIVDNNDDSETVLMKIPMQTVDEFCKETGAKVSVSGAFMFAMGLKVIGLEKKADEIIKKAVEEAHNDGVRVQISTWGSKTLHKILGPKKLGKPLAPREEVKTARQAGIIPTDVIYDHDAVGTAAGMLDNRE